MSAITKVDCCIILDRGLKCYTIFFVYIPPSAGPAAPTTQVMVKLTLSAMFLCLLVKQAIMATHTEQPFVPSAKPQTTKYNTK